jgi:hypothetical protein
MKPDRSKSNNQKIEEKERKRKRERAKGVGTLRARAMTADTMHTTTIGKTSLPVGCCSNAWLL